MCYSFAISQDSLTREEGTLYSMMPCLSVCLHLSLHSVELCGWVGLYGIHHTAALTSEPADIHKCLGAAVALSHCSLTSCYSVNQSEVPIVRVIGLLKERLLANLHHT